MNDVLDVVVFIPLRHYGIIAAETTKMDDFLHNEWWQHADFQCGLQCSVSAVHRVSAISQSRHVQS